MNCSILLCQVRADAQEVLETAAAGGDDIWSIIGGVAGALMTLAIPIIAVYFNRKMQNLADAEDLENLTTIVEEVKSEFNRDLAVLNSRLGITGGAELAHRNHLREFLMQFYESCINLHERSTRVLPTPKNMDLEIDSNFLAPLYQCLQENRMAENRLTMLIDLPDELTQCTSELRQTALEMYEKANDRRPLMFEIGVEFDMIKAEREDKSIEKKEAYNRHAKNRKKLKDLTDDWTNQYRPVIKKFHDDLHPVLRTHFRNLIESTFSDPPQEEQAAEESE